MKILTYISRIFVGALFIVSGLIKANDTLGFSYKLEEYFENGALAYRIRDWFGWDSFSLEFLMEHALMLAIIMCAAEIILGFAILFGTKMKFAVYSLLGLTIMFFFLTLHTATCDPFASYNEVNTVEIGSPEHTRFVSRMEANPKIIIKEETEKNVTFVEEMPVQCVTDCGCFGDALKGSLGRSLTPWESWRKDLVLLLFLIPIYLFRNKIKINTTREDLLIGLSSLAFVGFLSWIFDWYAIMLFFAVGYLGYFATKRLLFNTVMRWIPILVVSLISLLFIYYTYNHLPLRDYRAYAVGKSIPDQMVLPKGAKESVYENVFYYKNKTTGVVEEFTESTYPWDDDNYEFADRDTKLLIQGDVAAITDFTIMADDGNDYAQDYFNEEGYIFMYIAYDINKTNEVSVKKINTFVDQCNANGSYIIGLTASLYNDVEDFRHKNQTMFDFYTCDAITLKTIVRANPGIVLIKKGNILGKWNANDLPDYELIKKEYLK
ncbi:MAG: hypothetical protein COB15_16665 [Flavobacteriales bacterium]|nr:MAG: hypothetical protein COB15_16665 [Flavobacteriales bacterium]